MGFDEFIDEFSNDEIQDLVDDINNNRIDAATEQRLQDAIEDTTMEERQAAFEERPAVVDLLVALDFEFEFPDGELGRGFDGEEQEEPDLEELPIEPVRPGEEPEREEPDVRPGPSPQRPDVHRPNADRDIARRFFNGNQRKGNAFASAEQERLSSRWEGLPPGEFWDRFGGDIWGGILSREEFVNPGS